MSKQQFKKEDFAHVTAAIVKNVEHVIADRKFGRYSSSLVYKAHNAVFKLNEPVQTCPSCLVTRSTKLFKWHEWWTSTEVPAPAAVQIPVLNKGVDDEPNAPQSTYDVEGGGVLTIDAEGQATLDGGPAHTDYIYFLTNGRSIVIDENGKVTPEATTYKEVVDKYALAIGGSDAEELATLQSVLDTDSQRITENEMLIVLQRHDELTKKGREATTYADVLAKYGIVIGDNEREVISNNEHITSLGLSTGEIALLQARYDELGAPQILLQKVNKDTYAPEGDALFGKFTADEADASKGTVVNAETGKALAPGTYATEDVKQVLVVAVGGKASYKAV